MSIVLPRPGPQRLHALLRHLEAVGFGGAPRLVGDGVDDAGRQVLVFIDGDSARPKAWSADGVVEAGRLLRDLHDATATFAPRDDAVWMPWYTHDDGPDTIIGHGDVGPWNLIARNGLPIAFIDWECAGPLSRLNEVAEAARLNCQLHGEDVVQLNDLPATPARVRQLRLFVDAYGLDTAERVGFVDRMIETAIRGCANDTDEAGITPTFRGPHPMVRGMAWQARAARWLLSHRRVLNNALGIAS